LPSFLAFLLAESVFNRYLLAVGNPMSLLTLLILFSLSMRAESAESLDNAPPRPEAVDKTVARGQVSY
jgi:hypothetical protein